MATNPSADGGNFNNNNFGTPEPYPRHHPDQLVPITNVVRIMRRILPPNAKVSEETKTIIQECISEYIHFITGEANERCHREQRRTITAEDLLYAHANLGFNNYVRPLTLFLERYRQNEATQNVLHGDPSVRRATYFPAMYTQSPTPLLASAPTLLRPMYPRIVHGSGFDAGSSSNPKFPVPTPFHQGFYPGAPSPSGSCPDNHDTNHGQ